MSPAAQTGQQVLPSFPRVSGDDPLQPWDLLTFHMFSPRERG